MKIATTAILFQSSVTFAAPYLAQCKSDIGVVNRNQLIDVSGGAINYDIKGSLHSTMKQTISSANLTIETFGEPVVKLASGTALVFEQGVRATDSSGPMKHMKTGTLHCFALAK